MFDFSTIVDPLIKTLIAVWIFIAVANKPRRSKLMSSLSDLIKTPTVFNKTENEIDKIPFYPRGTFEHAAEVWKESVLSPIRRAITNLDGSVSSLLKAISSESEKPWKAINYLIELLLLIGFLLADLIVITNTLELVGLYKNLPEILGRYEVAVTFGSLVSIVIGGLVSNDITGNGEFTDWGLKKETSSSKNVKFLSRILIWSGLLVIFFLGLARFGRIMEYPESVLVWLRALGNLSIHVITPINAGIAAYLVAEDGVKGLKIVLLVPVILVWVFLLLAGYILSIVISTVIFFIDVIWRLILGLGSIAFFLAITPIDEASEQLKRKSTAKENKSHDSLPLEEESFEKED